MALGGHAIPEDIITYKWSLLTWKSCTDESRGQMSDSPQNGDTVMVFSSRIGKLLLNPPSMYLTLSSFGGMKPEKNGTKALAINDWKNKICQGFNMK